jgi:lysozyme
MATTLSRKVLALVAAGASAAAIATQFLQEKEGPDALVAYQDDNAVWTACMGVTKGVHAGSRFTPQQCKQMDKEAVSEAAAEVDRIVKVPMSEPERAAVISFCAYNIGPGKCSQSTFLKDLNAGNRAAACAQINRWIFDGGRDCRIRSNGCAGQVVRRQQETELCRMN